MVKIDFELDPQDWHGSPHEGLWAEPVSDTKNSAVFQLKNSPFYARGVSFLDIVEAYPAGVVGRFKFDRVIQKSGHSTYRLMVDKMNGEFPVWWSRLENLGCTYESTHFGPQKLLYSVDVPEMSDIHAVYDILAQGEKKLIWLFEEGDVGHDLSKNAKPTVS